jgi:hypothetical protein
MLSEKSSSIGEESQEQLFEFALQYIECSLDAVGFMCVDIFINLLKLHFIRCPKCEKSWDNATTCGWFQTIAQNYLMDSTNLSNCRLKALVGQFCVWC